MKGGGATLRRVVRHDLMAEQVEIHPGFRTSPLRAPKHGAVEVASLRNIMHGESHVERGEGCARLRVSLHDGIHCETLRLEGHNLCFAGGLGKARIKMRATAWKGNSRF
jgi:hypothetical protein